MTLHVSYMLIHRFFNHCFFCHILQAIFAEMMTHPGLIVGATPGVVAVVASETPSAILCEVLRCFPLFLSLFLSHAGDTLRYPAEVLIFGHISTAIYVCMYTCMHLWMIYATTRTHDAFIFILSVPPTGLKIPQPATGTVFPTMGSQVCCRCGATKAPRTLSRALGMFLRCEGTPYRMEFSGSFQMRKRGRHDH